MSSQTPRDFTPESGAPTDVAPIGRTGPKPAHELTAEEERGNIDWEAIAAQEDFKKLLAAKARFIVPASIFFVVYYFALPVLVGYATQFMETKIFGAVNIAYVFALSQFFMAWIIAALYVRAAGRFDKAASDIINKLPKK